MDTYDDESRLELNLDNRKLIIGFAGLMIVCAVFFVFGFVEGKRQAPKTESRAEGIAPPAPELKAASQPEAIPAGSNSASKPPEKAVAEQLDWYRKVNRRGTPSTRELSSIKPKQPAGPPAGRESSRPRGASQKVTYSVQIGAFRQRPEAENRAAVLKAKGYEYFIEPPKDGSELYLLKVGRFDSRPAAVAAQLKLKRDGFSSFIKSN